jgi:hypothetical protein
VHDPGVRINIDVPDPDWFLDQPVVRHTANRGSASIDWHAFWREQLALAVRAVDRAVAPAVTLAARQGFVVSVAQLREAGVDDGTRRRLLRRGTWTSAGRGVVAVVRAEGDVRAAERVRHALKCSSAALVRPDQAVSGRSAAVLHGLPTRVAPELPETTTVGTCTLGRRASAHVYGAALVRSELTHWYGVAVTAPARTVVDLARHDRGDGLIAADAALRDSQVTRAQLFGELTQATGWPGVRGARAVVALASPLSESPLESLTRLAAHDAGLSAPELQVTITDPSSGQRYRVDFLWREQRLVLEADGRIKYSGDELWREKRRELALNRLGYRVMRVIWDDIVRDTASSMARLRSALASSPLQ